MFNKWIKTASLCILAGTFYAEDIKLPKPDMTGGKPLMQALKDRKSTRGFKKDKLSDQQLSNLLWAACGINRPETGKRTAPSAHNWQDVSVYVALENGLYLYDEKNNTLKDVVKEDLRSATGFQKFVGQAPLNLIYVADYNKMKTAKTQTQKVELAGIHTGLISQNVSLFCASEGFGTVVRGWVDKEELAKDMKLPDNKKVVLCQTVGMIK